MLGGQLPQCEYGRVVNSHRQLLRHNDWMGDRKYRECRYGHDAEPVPARHSIQAITARA